MSATDATKRLRRKALDLRLAARRAASELRQETKNPLVTAHRYLSEARAQNDFRLIRHWSLVCKFLSDVREEFEPVRLSELDDGRAICRIFMSLSTDDRRKVIEFASSLTTGA